ncbi:hypothetical protein [Azorhizophilus paspali]|uniref:hypothetical protein n=1 Tax=Azorhizophilus paspali TaxID=69963 RepID=UPI0036722C65
MLHEHHVQRNQPARHAQADRQGRQDQQQRLLEQRQELEQPAGLLHQHPARRTGEQQSGRLGAGHQGHFQRRSLQAEGVEREVHLG